MRVERRQVAQESDPDASRSLRERRRDDVGRRHEAVGFRVVLVDADRVESIVFVEDHLVEMLGVDLLATHRIERGVRVRVVRGLRQVRPRHQVEGVDFHRTMIRSHTP